MERAKRSAILISMYAETDPAMDPESPFDRALSALAATNATMDPVRLRAWSELGLTIPQLRLLGLIRRNPGVTVSELATHFAVNPSSITGLVDRLVTQEYLRREDDPADRRRVRHFLTPFGTSALNQRVAEYQNFVAAIFIHMSPDEIESFIASHEAFLDAYRRSAVSQTDPASNNQPLRLSDPLGS